MNYLNFEKVNFPFLNGDFPRSPFYGKYILQLIRFANVCSSVSAFNNRNQYLIANFYSITDIKGSALNTVLV